MSKSCCFAVVLAVICLSVILLSLEADAQPTVDETMTCSASTLEEVMDMVKIVAANQQENTEKMKEIKNNIDRLRDEMQDVRILLGLVSGINPSKQTNVTELVGE